MIYSVYMYIYTCSFCTFLKIKFDGNTQYPFFPELFAPITYHSYIANHDLIFHQTQKQFITGMNNLLFFRSTPQRSIIESVHVMEVLQGVWVETVWLQSWVVYHAHNRCWDLVHSCYNLQKGKIFVTKHVQQLNQLWQGLQNKHSITKEEIKGHIIVY